MSRDVDTNPPKREIEADPSAAGLAVVDGGGGEGESRGVSVREHRVCLNCGEALTGRFCSACGQEDRVPNRELGALIGDLLGSLFSLESRFWRCLLPLLFVPGRVTEDYLAGKRANGIPPLRLYLFVSMLFFLTFSIEAPSIQDVDLYIGGEQVGADLADGEASMQLSLFEKGDLGGILGDEAETYSAKLRAIPPQLLLDRLTVRFQAYLPRAFLLSLPIFALLLRLLYPRGGRSYVEHLVLSAHFQSAVFLYLIPVRFLPGFGAGALWALFVCFVLAPLYLSVGLRRVMGSPWWSTVLRVVILQSLYFLLTLVALASTYVWVVLHLA